MTRESDLELLRRWRVDNDRRAGNELVAGYFDQIRSYFLNAVDDAVREDLVQETFHRLLKAVDNFEGRSSFRTYLFSIARYVKLDFYKRKYKGKGKFDELEHSVVDIEGVSPSHLVTTVERHQQLLACIRALPDQTKDILELYYWHDFTARELAETVGISVPALKARLFAARKRLRECLQVSGEGGGDADEQELDTSLRELGRFFACGRAESRSGFAVERPGAGPSSDDEAPPEGGRG